MMDIFTTLLFVIRLGNVADTKLAIGFIVSTVNIYPVSFAIFHATSLHLKYILFTQLLAV
ncbi:MAG: hypothetical protein WCG25_09760 [bacterium]